MKREVKIVPKKKPKTVDEVYRMLCKKDEVLIDGQCTKILINPKKRTVVYKEYKTCKRSPPKVEPVLARAQQRLFKDIFKDPKSRYQYHAEVELDDKEVIPTV